MKTETYAVLVLLTVSMMAFVSCANYSEGDDENGARSPAVSIPFQGQADVVASISNRDQKPTTTHIEVSRGDTLQIVSAKLVKDQFTQSISESKHEDHETCVAPEDHCLEYAPIYESQCRPSCQMQNICFPFTGCQDVKICKQVCEDVQVGKRCTKAETRCNKSENHWTETKSYGDPKITGSEELSNSDKRNAAVLSGLQLQFFDQSGNPRGASCPIQSFNPKVTANMISIPVINTKECGQLFADNDASKLRVSVSNKIELPESYLIGDEVHAWDNQITQPPKTSTQMPRIDFTGTLRVPSL